MQVGKSNKEILPTLKWKILYRRTMKTMFLSASEGVQFSYPLFPNQNNEY